MQFFFKSWWLIFSTKKVGRKKGFRKQHSIQFELSSHGLQFVFIVSKWQVLLHFYSTP
jgi:hypothetical protein